MKVGYVAVVGKANAGKSTLVNKLVGEKVSIVSPKAQTTRNNIIGIKNGDDYQIVFVDTPGIHISNNQLDKFMSKSIRSVIDGVDVIVYILEAKNKISEDEMSYIKKISEGEIPVVLAVSKTDLTTFEKLYPALAKLNEIATLSDIVPISTIKNRNLDILVDKIIELLPESEYLMFSKEEVTDKSENFQIAEIIREKTLYLLEDEIPHGIAVEIVSIEEDGNLINISADIICEKDSHKTIIIGKQGSMIKKIGQKTREELEKLYGKKIMLTLYVKIERNWRNNPKFLNTMGYTDKL